MIRHVVVFTFRDGTADAQIAEMMADLATLPSIVPEVRSFRLGRDIGVNSGNFQLAVTADFDDVAGYLAYRDNTEHQRMIREKGAKIVEQRAAVQFEF
jgi:hypothetical protein